MWRNKGRDHAAHKRTLSRMPAPVGDRRTSRRDLAGGNGVDAGWRGGAHRAGLVRPRRSGTTRAFEDANGVTVNVKKFEGTGAGLAVVEQSRPGGWDMMVIDSIDGSITGRGGTISGLPTGRGGVLHTLPILVPDLDIAVRFAYTVVAEGSRRRSFRSSLRDDRLRGWLLARPGRHHLR
jgi:hypothetical protein